MNARQREKRRLTLLINVDLEVRQTGKLPAWWWVDGAEALRHDPRWPLRSKRYRAHMRRAGHAVGGGRPSFKRFAYMGAGCAPMTYRQWEQRKIERSKATP